MSQSVVLMVPLAFDSRGLMAAFPEPLSTSVEISEDGQLLVLRGGSDSIARISELGPRDDVAADFGRNGLHRPSFRALVPHLRFFLVCYWNWLIFRSFLRQLLEGWRGELDEVWLDDDYGQIWNGPEFLDKLKADSDWDWRDTKVWYLSLISRDHIPFGELARVVRAVHPDRITVDEEHHELAFWDSKADSQRSVALALYAFNTAPDSSEDPYLLEHLTETFGQSILGLSCFLLRFTDYDVTKNILKIILGGLGEKLRSVRIDFDHNTVLSGEETLEYLHLEPDWDWR